MENRPVSQRKILVDNKHKTLSIRKQCQLLEVNRSSLYYAPIGESKENLQLMEQMDKTYLKHPTFGVLRMQDRLKDQGYIAGRERVRRLLRLMGIEAIYPKRNLSKLGKAKYIHPYLLRNLKIDRPNQVWAIDITYIPMQKGFMYLTAVIDIHSRFIIGWQLSNTLAAENQTRLIEDCIARYGKPEIINSDQGSQYTSEEWVSCLNRHKISISMDGKGRATDNAFVERFFRTIKWDYIYLNPAADGLELYEGINNFIHEYNYKNSHQGIGRIKPAQLYPQAA